MYSQQFLENLYRTLYTIRVFETQCVKLCRQGLIVGAGIPIGVGAALGARIRGTDQVAAAFFSDGAANNGVFPESLNMAAIWDLPVIFVLENNQYAVSSPVEEMTRVPDLFKRGEAYGVPSSQVDGNDVLAVYERLEHYKARDPVGLGRRNRISSRP